MNWTAHSDSHPERDKDKIVIKVHRSSFKRSQCSKYLLADKEKKLYSHLSTRLSTTLTKLRSSNPVTFLTDYMLLRQLKTLIKSNDSNNNKKMPQKRLSYLIT